MIGKHNREDLVNKVEELTMRYDQIVAERKSLYSIVDKLTGYCEGMDKRIDSLNNSIEVLEKRVTELEVSFDRIIPIEDVE